MIVRYNTRLFNWKQIKISLFFSIYLFLLFLSLSLYTYHYSWKKDKKLEIYIFSYKINTFDRLKFSLLKMIKSNYFTLLSFT